MTNKSKLNIFQLLPRSKIFIYFFTITGQRIRITQNRIVVTLWAAAVTMIIPMKNRKLEHIQLKSVMKKTTTPIYKKQDKKRRKLHIGPFGQAERAALLTPFNPEPPTLFPIDNKYSRGSWKTFFQNPPLWPLPPPFIFSPIVSVN